MPLDAGKNGMILCFFFFKKKKKLTNDAEIQYRSYVDARKKLHQNITRKNVEIRIKTRKVG